jgi:hypothetical protein
MFAAIEPETRTHLSFGAGHIRAWDAGSLQLGIQGDKVGV